MQAYVTRTGQFLPGAPVNNAEMADYIGRLSPEAERRGRLTLRQNRIRRRHYALDPDGASRFSAAEMAARALDTVLDEAELDREDVGLLAAATTQGDQMVPGFASGVHAATTLPPVELANHQSVCASSIMALQTAARAVKAGDHAAALVVGAEFSSRYFRPGHYLGTDSAAADGVLPGDAEFLRWTLSDGAAGLLLENRPARRGLSLRLDWVSLRSFADRFAPCMTAGSVQDAEGRHVPWSQFPDIASAAAAGAFQLRQDVAALHRMLPVWMGEFMRLVDAGRIAPEAVDWFCCHYSSHSLRKEMVSQARKAGCLIPEERWFTNLYDKGNVGAASIFLILDDLMRSGNLQPGDQVLAAVPESGQCIMAFASFTAVTGENEDD